MKMLAIKVQKNLFKSMGFLLMLSILSISHAQESNAQSGIDVTAGGSGCPGESVKVFTLLGVKYLYLGFGDDHIVAGGKPFSRAVCTVKVDYETLLGKKLAVEKAILLFKKDLTSAEANVNVDIKDGLDTQNMLISGNPSLSGEGYGSLVLENDSANLNYTTCHEINEPSLLIAVKSMLRRAPEGNSLEIDGLLIRLTTEDC